jgi:hypothetical protein
MRDHEKYRVHVWIPVSSHAHRLSQSQTAHEPQTPPCQCKRQRAILVLECQNGRVIALFFPFLVGY